MTRLFVIGGGISGLATAFRLRQRFQEREVALDLKLLEAEERVGGKIRSEREDGYLMEWGPNGFLDNKPDTLALCSDLGIEGDMLPSHELAQKRYVFSEGRLHRVPESPLPFFRSQLLSRRGRMRILREPLARVTPPGLDTSIAEFGRRRLGREAAEKLLDPMVSGIFAGDPALLSLGSCFPRILELEQKYGSLFRAMISLQKEEGREKKGRKWEAENGTKRGGGGKSRAGPAGPGGTLTSFATGMECLVRILHQRLGDAVQTRSVVTSLVPEAVGDTIRYRIQYRHQGAEREDRADVVVLAVPAHEAGRILSGVDSSFHVLLDEIPYAPLVVVGLGFPEGEAPGSLDGFGFLVPYAEKTPVLGSLWTSSIFSARAPAGHVFTRNMVGGWRNAWATGCDDETLILPVFEILEKALGSKGKAVFQRIVRHTKAIPLYTVGHGQRLREMEKLLQNLPGLYITGNAFRGVALNDCTREALRVAKQVEEDQISKMSA